MREDRVRKPDRAFGVSESQVQIATVAALLLIAPVLLLALPMVVGFCLWMILFLAACWSVRPAPARHPAPPRRQPRRFAIPVLDPLTESQAEGLPVVVVQPRGR